MTSWVTRALSSAVGHSQHQAEPLRECLLPPHHGTRSGGPTRGPSRRRHRAWRPPRRSSPTQRDSWAGPPLPGGPLWRAAPVRTCSDVTSLHLLNGFGQVAAVAGLPLVVCLDQHRAGEAEQCRLVGEDADHVGPALDLLVQPLQRVGAPQLLPVGWREVGELGDVGLASSSIAATVGNLGPSSRATSSTWVGIAGPVGLGEDGADRGGDHLRVALADIWPARCAGRAPGSDARSPPGRPRRWR